jgi:thiosulfate dehydrogenase
MSRTQFFLGVVFVAPLFFSPFAQAIEPTSIGANIPLQVSAVSIEKSEMIKRGEYVARLGDCIACHTAPNGQNMAGGLELKTPFGALYSTNITPDKQTGIGRYTFEQFDRVMRKGVAADGRNLYSAMPYVCLFDSGASAG